MNLGEARAHRVGETLTASTTGIDDPDGLTSPTFTYRWMRVDRDGVSNPTNIGTNAPTYTLIPADEGKRIKLRVEFRDDGGNAETRTSDAFAASGPVAAALYMPPPPVSTTPLGAGVEHGPDVVHVVI